MPTIASMIKENGDIFIVVLSDRGDPVVEFPEDDWRMLAVKSYELLDEAKIRKDELRKEGKIEDPFWMDNGWEHGIGV